MTEPIEGGVFEKLREDLTSVDPSIRRRALDDLIRRYLPRIQLFAHRAFFAQLRPTVTTQDVTSRVCQKLASRLERGKIELRSEREFLALLKLMTARMLSDMARRSGPVTTSLDAERGEVGRLDVPSAEPTASIMAREQERQELIGVLAERLRRALQPDEYYLIRRHFLEGATYAELAAELGSGTGGRVQSPDALRMRLKRLRSELLERDDFRNFLEMLSPEA